MGQNIINFSKPNRFSISENLGLFRVRAKYIPQRDGTYKLSSVCEFSQPVFNPQHLEHAIPEDHLAYGILPDENSVLGEGEDAEKRRQELWERATRRAKTAAFDLVCSNPDLNLFLTLTYSSEFVQRDHYAEVYGKLKVWLSNLVSRHGFKYVAVPEYHKDGAAIHFHMICNQNGLKLMSSGHYRNGEVVYNLKNWKWGFSTAIMIGKDEDDRERVSKYIYKYMGKQAGQKVGGRYYLHGGDLDKPVYLYSDDPQEFFGGDDPKFMREKEITSAMVYREWNFI